METFKDFATWAGSQREAARLIGIDKYRAHRLYHGRKLTPDEAVEIERVSGGVFRAAQLIFGLGQSPNTARAVDRTVAS